ncbi:protein SHQ1 [Pimephales promelas]|nr:protein SHQ1 [Pimephales promelas]
MKRMKRTPAVAVTLRKKRAKKSNLKKRPKMTERNSDLLNLRRMIEELGESLEAGLTIEEDVPRGRRSISGSNTEREGERKREADYYHRCAAETERDATKAATSRELLDPCLQRNPLRIISTDELDSDDDGDLLLTLVKEGP